MSDTEATKPATEPTVRGSTNKLADSVLGTRNLMTTAAIGVVACLIIIPISYLFVVFAVSPNGVLLCCALMGAWFYPFALPGAVVRKPGAVMIAALIIGIITTFTTPAGATALVGNLLGGVLVELGLLVTRYRNWRWLGFGIAAVIFGVFNGASYGTVMKIDNSIGFAVLCSALSVASCLAVVALLNLTVRVLNKSGVAKHLAASSK